MDRRDFLKAGAAAAFLAGTGAFKSYGAHAAPSGLRVRFLGTGAADWDGPDERGELRRFSSVLLDERIIIDFTASSADMLPQRCSPEAIFLTHSHNDHFDPEAILSLGAKRIYMGDTWAERARENFAEASRRTGIAVPELVPLAIGQKASCGDIDITALPANHSTSYIDEQTLIYLVEKGPVRLLYATDTGGIMSRAARIAGIDLHFPGKPITALIMEATMSGDEDFRLFTHSSIGTVLRTVNMLTNTGRYTPAKGQKVYLTHLARTLHGTQAQLDASLPSPLRAAHDGLEVLFMAS